MPSRIEVMMSSLSPYSSSKYIESEKKPKEKPDVHEERCWRERLSVGDDGMAIIPGMAFKKALVAAQRYDEIKLKGNKNYGQVITSGVLPETNLSLNPVTRETVAVERVFVPSDGKPGGGKRVMKFFPLVPQWSGTVSFLVLDDRITESIIESLFRNAGAFIGVGRWRVEKGGMYGRFKLESIKSQDI